MAGASIIDSKLTAAQRRRVIEALTDSDAKGIEPDYRGLVKRLELPCSYSALFRFHRNKVKPAVGRSLAKLANAQPPKPQRHATAEVIAETNTTDIVKRDTRQALADDPIVAAVMVKRLRMATAIGKTHEAEEWDAYTKLENADTKALELLGKATMHPGFTSAPQVNITNQQIVVMPAGPDIASVGEVIDIEPE
jgi:hypothetical protein